MKKLSSLIFLILLCGSLFYFGFSDKDTAAPDTYYQVYLDNKVLGVIKSKDKLLKMIDKKGEYIKKKYNVNKVYEPDGLEIRRITTYDDKLDSEKEIYNRIEDKKPFTIRGYQLTIKNEKEDKKFYVTSKSISEKALEGIAEIYVGKEAYENYKEDKQREITTTGSVIENIYFEDDMTMKQMNIPVTNRIYTDEIELSKNLLFGNNANSSKYTVIAGDTIEQVAFKNKISVDEFLISNPGFSSKQSLLFPGQEVVIGVTNPQVKVVVERHVVKDIVSLFKTEERYDPNKLVGEDEVIQQGENGLERVSQKERIINGVLNYVDPKGKQEIKPTTNRIISVGNKVIADTGSTAPGTWAWPTNSGYTISSDFAYRINPITGGRELHTGIDISGLGHGSPIYAANNGVVVTASRKYDNGIYVTINHNNGYYTLYAHMARYTVRVGQTVAKGQLIGYIGQTGYATGPHLHFEVWRGGAPWRGSLVSPWSLYR